MAQFLSKGIEPPAPRPEAYKYRGVYGVIHVKVDRATSKVSSEVERFINLSNGR